MPPDSAGEASIKRRDGLLRRWALMFACAAGVVGAGPIASGMSLGATSPRCFGAAARDTARPCHNPRLERSVVPKPIDAQITPNLPCYIAEHEERSSFRGGVSVCAFGVPSGQAARTVALIGDSHAMNRRAPLEVVAQAKRWRALSIARSHCILSATVTNHPGPDRDGCVRWNRGVIGWLHRHPEVTVVFVAQASRPVVGRRGQAVFAAQVAGHRRAWHALPSSVEHIVVLRDNPRIRLGTFGCVHRAVAAHLSPGRACALPRGEVLLPDAAAVAAAQSRSRRVHLVDLTRYICSRRLCYPVVGGVLVNKDLDHLTRVFATTLGQFLLRRVNRLMS
jgi:hypothetical protein